MLLREFLEHGLGVAFADTLYRIMNHILFLQ